MKICTIIFAICSAASLSAMLTLPDGTHVDSEMAPKQYALIATMIKHTKEGATELDRDRRIFLRELWLKSHEPAYSVHYQPSLVEAGFLNKETSEMPLSVAALIKFIMAEGESTHKISYTIRSEARKFFAQLQ